MNLIPPLQITNILQLIYKEQYNIHLFSTKEKRSAALDLANMAASSTDNKFALVAEGGLVNSHTSSICRGRVIKTRTVY